MTRTATILGCGSSGGVPRVGQGWGACDPADPKNRRRRCSILIERETPQGATRVLVDTSPDLREQLLGANVAALDAVILTHDHADHTHGVDDLRPLVIHMRRRIDIYADEPTRTSMLERFRYCFEAPPGSDYPPILNLKSMRADAPLAIEGAGGAVTFTPFRVRHGSTDALGLRIGGLAYTPDASDIYPESIPALSDLDLWIVDALRPAPHPSHFSLSDALGWIERLKPKRAVLTNLHSDLDYATLAASLPAHVTPAHDGLRIAF